jgi:hypothetical protein
MRWPAGQAVLTRGAGYRVTTGTRKIDARGAGSGARGRVPGDREIPVAPREIQRPNNQEEGGPAVDAAREAHDARSDRDTATGNSREPKDAKVAVLPRADQARQAGSRGSGPPTAQTCKTEWSFGAFIGMPRRGSGGGNPLAISQRRCSAGSARIT